MDKDDKLVFNLETGQLEPKKTEQNFQEIAEEKDGEFIEIFDNMVFNMETGNLEPKKTEQKLQEISEENSDEDV